MKLYKKLISLLLTFNLVLFQSIPLNAIGTPAGTIISSGGDRGEPGIDDVPGDTIVRYDGGISVYATSNVVDVKVSTGYAIAPLKDFKDKIPVRIGFTEYIPYSVCNLGNAVDVFSLSYSSTPNPNWSVGFTADHNQDRIHQPEEVTPISSAAIAADTTYYFFIAVKASSNTSIGEIFTATMVVKNQNGTGLEDNWLFEDGNDIRTTELNFVAVPPDTKPPSIPVGLKTIVSEDKKSVTLTWNSSTEKDIYGYFVYRALSIQELINISTYSYYVFLTTNTFTDEHFYDTVVYYKVKSIDRWWNISEDSMCIDTKEDGDIIFACIDENKNIRAKLLIPKNNNTKIENLHIKIQRLKNEETVNDIGVYKLQAYKDGNPEKPVENVEFGNDVELRLYYTDADLRRKNISPENAKNRLSLFYHNGVEWVNICGLIREDKKYLYIKLTHLSKYKISFVNLPREFTIISIAPHKIFVPREDSEFSKIKFTLRYPPGNTPTGKIFDIIGTPIRDLIPVLTRESGDMVVSYFEWDGKDKFGNYVPSGIYIYQFECGNKTINGTIIVAK